MINQKTKEIVDNLSYCRLCTTKNLIQNETIYIRPDETHLSARKKASFIRIAELQKYYQKNPVNFIRDFFNIRLLDFQALLIQAAWTTPNVLVVASRGISKAVDRKTRVPTTNGDKTIADIQVGDYVFDQNGKPVQVCAKSEVFNKPCYKVIFNDGEEIVCSDDHLWTFWTKDGPVTETVEWFMKNFRKKKYFIPIAGALEFPKKDLLVDPYILGLWLGDGFKDRGRVVAAIADADEIIHQIEKRGYRVTSSYECGGTRRIIIGMPDGSSSTTALHKLGVTNKKHIPEEYFYSDYEDRMELLRGLMDSDGTPSLPCSWTQSYDVHRQLCDDFERLVSGLGIRYRRRHFIRPYSYKGKTTDKESVVFYMCSSKENPVFSMQRKYDRLKDTLNESNRRKEVVQITKCQPIPTQCISVDSDSQLFQCGRHNTITHNSTSMDIFTMAKGMLFNNYWTYIASGSGAQARQTFETLEKLANDNIDSMVGSTGYIFKNELKVSPNNDGFTHGSDGHRYELYNGSYTSTLTSATDRNRGKRGNVLFDETGWLSAEMLKVYGAFAVVNKEFKTGTGSDGNDLTPLRMKTLPKDIQNQLFYMSSASSTDTEYYRLYRDFSRKMIMGDRNYFVLHLDCEAAFYPLMGGKVINPLLSKEKVDADMRTNREKALREYYCIFTSDAGSKAIIKRAEIQRRSEVRKPVLFNDTGDKQFVIAWDPARMSDNSIIGVGEIYDDPHNGKCMRIVNAYSLADRFKKNKTPMNIQNQIEVAREMLVVYNGEDNIPYSNILSFYIDAGAGGQAGAIMDLLGEPFRDKRGVSYPGLIDPNMNERARAEFPDALEGLLTMQSPVKMKSVMFDHAIQMFDGGFISFPADYDNKGYLSIIDEKSKDFKKLKEDKIQELLDQGYGEHDVERIAIQKLVESQAIKTSKVNLSPEEERSLSTIDLMKEQICNMERIKRDSKDAFQLIPEKQNTMHDDAAYVFALLGHALFEIRRQDLVESRKVKGDLDDAFMSKAIRMPKIKKGMF